jgi:tellurite resistance protein TerC
MDIYFLFWVIFIALFIVVFSVDVILTGHRHTKMRFKTAALWTIVWISAAVLFSAAIYFFYPEGEDLAVKYLAAYIVEYSLSIDNLFVFILIFASMGIPASSQPRILKWGIVGAVLLRILFIAAGVELLHAFHFTIYLFGLILVVTSIKMLAAKDKEVNSDRNLFVKIVKKYFKVDTTPDTEHFFTKKDNVTYITLAFITLLMVESTDLIFAVDSIPAVLAITDNYFIAITSNLFAILGLRALFFTISGVLDLFRYLKYGISFILLFIGLKMLVSGIILISVKISLIIIVLSVAVSIIASLVIKPKKA